MLTEKEKKLVCQAACNLESGRYLLRKMPPEEKKMMGEVCVVLRKSEDKQPLSDRENEILEEYRLCTDYEYAQLIGNFNATNGTLKKKLRAFVQKPTFRALY